MRIKSQLNKTHPYFFNLRLTNDNVESQFKNIIKTNDQYNVNCQIVYNNNICIIHSEIYSKEEISETIEVEGEYVKIVYLKEGNPRVVKEKNKSIANHPSFTIKYCENTKDQFEMKQGETTKLFMIYFRRTYFIYLLKKEEWSLKNNFFIKVLTKQIHLQSFPLQGELCAIFRSIKKCTMVCEENNFYFLSLKIREFILKIHQSNSIKQRTLINKNINISIFNKIRKAKLYIDKHYQETPTLSLLADLIESNELQLREYFKKAYGQTIRSYIIELKMKNALSLIEQYPVNEITVILGYKSVSHFITTFKNFYGCTPSKMKGKHLAG